MLERFDEIEAEHKAVANRQPLGMTAKMARRRVTLPIAASRHF